VKNYIITYWDSTDEIRSIDCYLECNEEELPSVLRRFRKDDWGVYIHEIATTTQLPEFLVDTKE